MPAQACEQDTVASEEAPLVTMYDHNNNEAAMVSTQHSFVMQCLAAVSANLIRWSAHTAGSSNLCPLETLRST